MTGERKQCNLPPLPKGSIKEESQSSDTRDFIGAFDTVRSIIAKISRDGSIKGKKLA